MLRIWIPSGSPSHLKAEIVPPLPEGSDIEWSNTDYSDGHREGVLYLANGQEYCVEEKQCP